MIQTNKHIFEIINFFPYIVKVEVQSQMLLKIHHLNGHMGVTVKKTCPQTVHTTYSSIYYTTKQPTRFSVSFCNHFGIPLCKEHITFLLNMICHIEDIN